MAFDPLRFPAVTKQCCLSCDSLCLILQRGWATRQLAQTACSWCGQLWRKCRTGGGVGVLQWRWDSSASDPTADPALAAPVTYLHLPSPPPSFGAVWRDGLAATPSRAQRRMWESPSYSATGTSERLLVLCCCILGEGNVGNLPSAAAQVAISLVLLQQPTPHPDHTPLPLPGGVARCVGTSELPLTSSRTAATASAVTWPGCMWAATTCQKQVGGAGWVGGTGLECMEER